MGSERMENKRVALIIPERHKVSRRVFPPLHLTVYYTGVLTFTINVMYL